MNRVKVAKTKPAKNPEFPTPEFDSYKFGQDNGEVSLPVDYTVTGILLGELKEGGFIAIKRDSRNGVECDGSFRSSTISKITKVSETTFVVETNNSVYIVESII